VALHQCTIAVSNPNSLCRDYWLFKVLPHDKDLWVRLQQSKFLEKVKRKPPIRLRLGRQTFHNEIIEGYFEEAAVVPWVAVGDWIAAAGKAFSSSRFVSSS